MNAIISSAAHTVQNSFFSEVILSSKQAKIVAVVLAILATLTLVLMAIHRFRTNVVILPQPVVPAPVLQPVQASAPVDATAEAEMLSVLAALPGNDDYRHKMFTYQTQREIEAEGGICLIPNRNLWGHGEEAHYVGIAVGQEEGKWHLKICPGGGYGSFTEQNFDELMPVAIRELVRRKITPEDLTTSMGRHPGDTLKNFRTWQAKHQQQ